MARHHDRPSPRTGTDVPASFEFFTLPPLMERPPNGLVRRLHNAFREAFALGNQYVCIEYYSSITRLCKRERHGKRRFRKCDQRVAPAACDRCSALVERRRGGPLAQRRRWPRCATALRSARVDDPAANLAEADAVVLALRPSGQDDFVVVLEERALAAVGKLQRLRAVPCQFEQRAV